MPAHIVSDIPEFIGLRKADKFIGVVLDGYSAEDGAVKSNHCFFPQLADVSFAVANKTTANKLFAAVSQYIQGEGKEEALEVENECAVALFDLSSLQRGKYLVIAADGGGSDCCDAALIEAAEELGLDDEVVQHATNFKPDDLRAVLKDETVDALQAVSPSKPSLRP